MAKFRLPPVLLMIFLTGLVLNSWWAIPAWGQLSLESPEVKAVVAKAIRFLESDDEKTKDDRPGAQALLAMTIIKSGAPSSHPKVVAMARAIQQRIQASGDPSLPDFDPYSLGLSTVFYCELDPVQYRSEILALLKALELRQKPVGGWGYPERSTGDTSMTQYGVLSMWEARQAGFEVPLRMIDNVADWLLRTQDPSGGFGYQGVPSPTYAPVPQSEVRYSLTAAGLGSVYIATNLLGLDGDFRGDDEKLPPALKEVQKGRPATKSRLDPRLFEPVKERGNRWMQANYQPGQPSPWHINYCFYAVERYWSIREAVEGKVPNAPPWYTDGARWLMKTQAADGSWKDASGVVPSTAFGALFLLRSMKKSIERAQLFGRGVLVGGRGLPKGTTEIMMREGQVVAKPLSGPAEQLLSAIEQAENPEHARAAEAMADLSIVDARKLVSAHEEKLRQLVSGGTPEAKRAAVQALARSHELDNVPTLIYAMSDPDPAVVLAAHDGLRRMSRRFDGFDLSDSYTADDLRRTIENWKKWYRSIRPDAEFEN